MARLSMLNCPLKRDLVSVMLKGSAHLFFKIFNNKHMAKKGSGSASTKIRTMGSDGDKKELSYAKRI